MARRPADIQMPLCPERNCSNRQKATVPALHPSSASHLLGAALPPQRSRRRSSEPLTEDTALRPFRNERPTSRTASTTRHRGRIRVATRGEGGNKDRLSMFYDVCMRGLSGCVPSRCLAKSRTMGWLPKPNDGDPQLRLIRSCQSLQGRHTAGCATL